MVNFPISVTSKYWSFSHRPAGKFENRNMIRHCHWMPATWHMTPLEITTGLQDFKYQLADFEPQFVQHPQSAGKFVPLLAYASA